MKGRLLLFVFALPFTGVGVWMGLSLWQMAADAVAVRGWQPVPARVLSGGYTTHSGDDATTWEAYGTYEYTVDGQRYTAQRVQLTGGADNIGDHQRRLGNRLERAAATGTPLTVYVDPHDPAMAIVDRELRWGLAGFKAMFLLIFGGAGTGMLLVSVWRRPAAATGAAADAPWLANPAWQGGPIGSSSRATMWGAWLFALLWNSVSLPLPFLLYDEVVLESNRLALLGLVFPLVGCGLLAWAVRRTLEWRRFGPMRLTLDPFPGSIGGHVGGTIETNLPFEPGRQFRLRLSSLHGEVTGSGKNRSRREQVLWQDEVLAHVESGPSGVRLVFRFDVPGGLEPSAAETGSGDYHAWRLHLAADLPGVDLDRNFDIPVYPTARRSERIGDGRAGAAAAVQAATYDAAARRRVRILTDGYGKKLVYPMGRHLTGNGAAILIGGSFAAAGWYLATRAGETLFGTVFGGIGVLVALAAAALLFRSLEVTLAGDTLTSTRYWLGLPLRRRSLRRSDFRHFETGSRLQTHSGSDTIRWYSVTAIGHDGKSVVVGENFAGTAEARAAERLLSAELGLSEKPARNSLGLNPVLFDRGAAPGG